AHHHRSDLVTEVRHRPTPDPADNGQRKKGRSVLPPEELYSHTGSVRYRWACSGRGAPTHELSASRPLAAEAMPHGSLPYDACQLDCACCCCLRGMMPSPKAPMIVMQALGDPARGSATSNPSTRLLVESLPPTSARTIYLHWR